MKRVILLMSLVAFLLLNVEAKKPTYLYLVGDEVVAEQTAAEDMTATSAVGWGQVLGEYLPGVEIINRGISGVTSKALLSGGDWADIIANAGRNSYMMIQLGHHEYDETNGQIYSSLEQFEKNLLQFVEEAKKAKVKVILLTPTTKRFFYDSTYYPRHGAYAEGVRRVAEQQGLPLIDVETATRAMVEAAGELGSAVYFAGDSEILLSEDGARAVAEIIAASVKEQKLKGLYTK